MDKLADFCELLACLFVGALGVILLIKIATDKIDLEWLISEDNGHASMSRFQLLIFTFVIAISLVNLTEKLNKFPTIDSGILTLLGISASTYAVGKGIQKAGGEPETPSPNSPKPNNPANPLVPGPSGLAEVAQQAAAEAARHSEAAGKAAQQADASANRAQSAASGAGGQGPERAI